MLQNAGGEITRAPRPWPLVVITPLAAFQSWFQVCGAAELLLRSGRTAVVDELFDQTTVTQCHD